MQVVNAAKHVATEVTFATDKHARTSLLVIFKATYSIPANDRMPRPQIPPQPVALHDTFAGEPGVSALLQESELAPCKNACDVLFRASAHTPDEKPHTRLDVEARVGTMSKTIRVYGNRVWEKDLLLLRKSRPEPFVSMPLHYGHAFGGTHQWSEGETAKWDAFQENPFGLGYTGQAPVAVHGLSLPNLEHPGRPIRSPYQGIAWALSPLPRTVPARIRHAGTYDQHWKENLAPFLPPDFDEHYYQCAPEDQRIPFPSGGEEIVLRNMMRNRPEVRFRLPRLDVVPVRVLHRDYRVSEPTPYADTLVFEPDEGRFSVVWRALVPIGIRGAREVRLVAVGQVCERWWEGIKNGASGCRGCGSAIRFASETRSEKSEDVSASTLSAATEVSVAPELCPESLDRPARDPNNPLPAIRFVSSETSDSDAEKEIL